MVCMRQRESDCRQQAMLLSFAVGWWESWPSWELWPWWSWPWAAQSLVVWLQQLWRKTLAVAGRAVEVGVEVEDELGWSDAAHAQARRAWLALALRRASRVLQFGVAERRPGCRVARRWMAMRWRVV
jgi:hypothetical protein